MKVYIVYYEKWDYIENIAVCSTEEKAKAYIAKLSCPNEHNYEEFELDKEN